MAAESFGVQSLPPTVAARRNARLRAAALATIPLILFVVAAVPRVLAPDLVPFGRDQVAYVSRAELRTSDSWTQLYATPGLSALTLVAPLLRDLPSPIVTWVGLRALLDALGVSLLYLAARPLVGPLGATLAGLLYAASPMLWALARDPAGALSPLLLAAALLASSCLVARPTLIRGAIVGLCLGLLSRSLPFGPLVVPLGAVSLAIARANWQVGCVTALALVLCAGPALFAWTRVLDGGSLTIVDTTIAQPLLALVLTLPLLVSVATVRWLARGAIVVLVVAGFVVIIWMMEEDMQAEWLHPAFVIEPSVPTSMPGMTSASSGSHEPVPNLREVAALADGLREVGQRVGTDEVVLLNASLPGSLSPVFFEAVVDGVNVRSLPGTIVLPLERETAYLISDDGERPGIAARAVEVQRPSSTVRVLTPAGADTGARIVTIRPRSATDWLARVHPVTNGQFADGSRLVGIDTRASESGYIDVALYWQLPVGGDGRSTARRLRVGLPDVTSTAARETRFPAAEDLRAAELVLTQVRLEVNADVQGPSRLRITLNDGQLAPIRTVGGTADLDVLLGAASR